jgi:hypothetical protein
MKATTLTGKNRASDQRDDSWYQTSLVSILRHVVLGERM